MFCRITIPRMSTHYKLYIYSSKSANDINTISKVRVIQPTYVIDEAIGAIDETVRYSNQSLTKEQKLQARTNIGASDFNGNYNDLTNKPTITTVNDATLTIQKNGTNVQTFTANSSTDKTANITVPTKVSELTNDSGYITSVSWEDVTSKPELSQVSAPHAVITNLDLFNVFSALFVNSSIFTEPRVVTFSIVSPTVSFASFTAPVILSQRDSLSSVLLWLSSADCVSSLPVASIISLLEFSTSSIASSYDSS